MRAQTEAAIELADAIFFMIDARVGITPTDRYFAQLVRRSGKPIMLLANKAEGKQGDQGFYEAFTLGFGDPIAISAEHDLGMADLHEALMPYLEQFAGEEKRALDEVQKVTDAHVKMIDELQQKKDQELLGK